MKKKFLLMLFLLFFFFLAPSNVALANVIGKTAAQPDYVGAGDKLIVSGGQDGENLTYIGIIIKKFQPIITNSCNDADYVNQTKIDSYNQWFIDKSQMISNLQANHNVYMLSFDDPVVRKAVFSDYEYIESLMPKSTHNLFQGNSEYKITVDQLYRTPDNIDHEVMGQEIYIQLSPINPNPPSENVYVSSDIILSDIIVEEGTTSSAIGLPDSVIVGLSNSSTTSAGISWDSGTPTYDGNRVGIYAFTGSLILQQRITNPNSKKVYVNVEVVSTKVYLTSVPKISNIIVEEGTTSSAIGLPNSVIVGLSNSSTTSAGISWDSGTPIYNGNIAGTYAFIGNLILPQGINNLNNQKVFVNVRVVAKNSHNEDISGYDGSAMPIPSILPTRIEKKVELKRIAGKTRVETAIQIAKKTYGDKIENVILCTASNFPDALSGSVLAAKMNAPILLLGDSQEEFKKVMQYINSAAKKDCTIYILGNSTVVNEQSELAIKDMGFKNIKRIGGSNRYETCGEIASEINVKEGTPVIVAFGEDFPDALVVSSVAADKGYPILLVLKNNIPLSIEEQLYKIKPSKIYIAGGENAVSKSVVEKIRKLIEIKEENIIRLAGDNRYATSITVAKYFDFKGNTITFATGKDFPDALAGSVCAAKLKAPILLVSDDEIENVKKYVDNMKFKDMLLFGGESVLSKKVEEFLIKDCKRQ